jgi:hypothetical protein
MPHVSITNVVNHHKLTHFSAKKREKKAENMGEKELVGKVWWECHLRLDEIGRGLG